MEIAIGAVFPHGLRTFLDDGPNSALNYRTTVKTPAPPLPGHSPLFKTTRWSLVNVAQDQRSPAAAAALEELCRAYWFPLYAFARRLGRSSHDAEDLTQAFFAQLLHKDYLHAADRERGRFRSFLLVAFKRFLANEWDKTQTHKRGGGAIIVPLDGEGAENRYAATLSEAESPDRDYERRWAMTLLEQTMANLRREYEHLDRLAEFECLKEYLTADRGTIAYAPIAASLQVTEGGARSAVHRLRRRFRELFRAAVSATVDTPAEVDEELRYLVRALSWE